MFFVMGCIGRDDGVCVCVCVCVCGVVFAWSGLSGGGSGGSLQQVPLFTDPPLSIASMYISLTFMI